MSMMAPRPEVTHNSPNQSSREGATPKLIVLHTTEGHNRVGVGDLRDLGDYFGRSSTQASSHVANDAEGNDARFVPDYRKAWTQAGYNRVSLSIEQVGFSSTSRTDWLNRKGQLYNTALWIAYWSKQHNIPIRRARVFAGRVLLSGVCQHSNLGSVGGNHNDCGPGYPFDHVLNLARAIAVTPPTPSPAPTPPKPTRPTPPAWPGENFHRGQRGINVRRIQQRLKILSDGAFGVNTERAVKSFQRKSGLTADGIVGRRTWNRLFA